MIFETHAHYDDEAFDEDRETLLASMQQNMIGCLVNVGASLESTQTSIQLAEQYPYIYAAAGCTRARARRSTKRSLNGSRRSAHIRRWWQSGRLVWITIGTSQTRQFRRNGLCASLNLQKRSKSQ